MALISMHINIELWPQSLDLKSGAVLHCKGSYDNPYNHHKENLKKKYNSDPY